MAVERIHIDQFLQLALDHPVIDVRSPGEYRHARLPGAHSLPLFSDEERKQVGTAYKQVSREAAIKTGLDYFGPKMKQMVEAAESLAGTGHSGNRTRLVYCWRGGMRSGAVSWLLDLYGFKVYTLAGGYKSFRNYILDSFRLPFRFHILGGYTGSGKTELLKNLQQRGERIIDLEGIAAHKGSAFGNIGMPEQPSQEMFENLLALELMEKSGLRPGKEAGPEKEEQVLWLEDESQRIGHVNLPNDLWKTMRESPVFFLDIPFEERLKHIAEEYGQLDRERMLNAIGRIREKLGGLNAQNAARLLEEGNTLESFRILLKYYDKFYLKGLHNRNNLNSLLHTVACISVSSENADKLIQYTRRQPQEV